MARNRNSLIGYEVAIAAANLREDILRLDTIERYAQQDGSFHYDRAIKAYERLKELMEHLIAETNAPSEIDQPPAPPSHAFEEMGMF